LHGRGTVENLLAMPITPVEVMLGKIIPCVLVGFVQAALIIGLGIGIFGVPVFGSFFLFAALSTLFITANLSIGYTFSTIAEPAAGDANVDDVLFAQHSAFRLHVSVRRNAGMGALDRRGPAAHALFAHRARHHAQRLRPCRLAQ
jgi:ABC-2 family transporter protein